jgi:glycosyltransferase involved in cell wall biosynthesis
LKLALFTNQFPGKVSTFFARDVRGLLEAGLQVDVFTIYPLDSSLWKWVPEVLNESVFPRDRVHHASLRDFRTRPVNRNWHRLPRFFSDTASISFSAMRFGPSPLVKSLYSCLLAGFWCQRFARNYDHVMSYWGNFPATCAYVFHRLAGRSIPFSLTLHAGTDLYRNQVFLRQKLLYADNIFVVCEFNREFIKRKFSDIYSLIESRIHLHHLGLDFSELPYTPQPRAAYSLIGVGTLSKLKGFDYLLRALSELRRRKYDVTLDLVGDGPEAGSLRSLCGELAISDHVRFHGWCDFAAVRDALLRATILVHPSISIGDAVPTVIKEAMALGTAVVASHVAGIPELLDGGRCGVLVPPRDVTALANGMESLLANPELREQFARAARERAEELLDLWRNTRQLAGILYNSCRRTAACPNGAFLAQTT